MTIKSNQIIKFRGVLKLTSFIDFECSSSFEASKTHPIATVNASNLINDFLLKKIIIKTLRKKERK